MIAADSDRARLFELRIAAAIERLSDAERAELQRLEPLHPDIDAASVAATVAALLEMSAPPAELPDHLRATVVSAADRYFGHERSPDDVTAFVPRDATTEPSQVHHLSVAKGWRRNAVTGWLAAAALGAVALGLWWTRDGSTPEAVVAVAEQQPRIPADVTRPSSAEPGPVGRPAAAGEPSVEEEARNLRAQRFNLVRAWRSGSDAAGRTVTGDVVWDGNNQRGFARFIGLPQNDPTKEQYQIWIFDAYRDERFPVDGGVFDVGKDGTVVVRIDPKVPVNTPTMFAVTVEKPGGVVVSDRSRLVATAPI
ncbi:MAG TPA: anti-sigma factor [Steroidobacteraceae bacterium]|nr:anti-sigma factor [Steroidobacteraceae bacterium]HRX89379.1 anti-sigma factor [Steroidobacteraceae bacterium]